MPARRAVAGRPPRTLWAQLAGLALGCAAQTALAQSEAMDLRFDVLLGDAPIGEHRFTVNHLPGDVVTVESDARFTVRVLSIPVFRYKHRASESWSDRCLTRIESSTRANRTRYAVSGERTAEPEATDAPFLLERSRDDVSEAETMASCLGSFAYWDIERLRRATLLNPQTGKLETAELVALDPAPLPQPGSANIEGAYGSKAFPHFELRTRLETIRLWYNEHGDWLALQTEQKGRDLTYQRTDLPPLLPHGDQHEDPHKQLASLDELAPSLDRESAELLR
ncbi:MAG: DUF6134 family protein [Pseudomonadota bacterium]